MENKEIYKNLCYYDRRNSLYDNLIAEDHNYNIKCSCDNCFYRRHNLALEILRLKNIHNKGNII